MTSDEVRELLGARDERQAMTPDGILRLSNAPSVPYDPWLDLSSTEAVRRALELGVAGAIATLTKGPSAADATRTNIYDLRRGSWQALCPLRRDSIVLDYGCGLGALSRALARRCASVIGLDACYERLMVNAAVNRESGVSNVLLAYGGYESLKAFADGSLDGFVLNGVLEWIPEQVEGRPRDVQVDFLRECRRVLKPDGWLYLGIENRWGFRYFLGRRDEHVGLLFSTLMPRWGADLYSRALRDRPYRTYTYGRRATERLLREAGFTTVDNYTPAPDYRHFELVVPVQGDPARARMGSALGVQKSWKQRLVQSRGFLNTFAPSLSVVAAPSGPVTPIWLGDLANSGSFPNHAYVKYDQASFWYQSGTGHWRIRELSLSDEADAKHARVAALAGHLASHPACPAALRRLSLHTAQGFTWLDRPAVEGKVLAAMPADWQRAHLDVVLDAMRRAHEIGRTLAECEIGLHELVDDYAPNRRETLSSGLNDLFDDVIRLLERRPRGAPLLMHGDCSAKNIVIGAQDAELIDWEWARVVGFPGYDVLKFAWHDQEDPRASIGPDPVAQAVRDEVARQWFGRVHPGDDWPVAVCAYWVVRTSRALSRFRFGGIPSGWISGVVQPSLESARRLLSRGARG